MLSFSFVEVSKNLVHLKASDLRGGCLAKALQRAFEIVDAFLNCDRFDSAGFENFTAFFDTFKVKLCHCMHGAIFRLFNLQDYSKPLKGVNFHLPTIVFPCFCINPITSKSMSYRIDPAFCCCSRPSRHCKSPSIPRI